jgi:uncharacterized damage-inducible protein DinB
MTETDSYVAELKSTQFFFNNTISVLTEEDSGFSPSDEMYSVAGQVAHVARTVDWFVDGAFSPDGFEMNFEEHIAQARAVSSLTEARAWLDRAFSNAVSVFSTKTSEELNQPLPQGPIMGGMPRSAVIGGITDHTAHHRGALSVYARLVGKTPPMPYGEV